MSVTDGPIRAIENEDQRLWTVTEAARFLQISPGTLFHWISQNRVPVIRLSPRCVRFSRKALLEWVAQLDQKPGGASRLR
jgi:excisionase family DNA binding protein